MTHPLAVIDPGLKDTSAIAEIRSLLSDSSLENGLFNDISSIRALGRIERPLISMLPG
ncbi:MAG: hypothetical protein GDA41_08035 [Rhodospirillales bacterium]|nr:hypothetical protein [Rhodospirillales bacterium]